VSRSAASSRRDAVLTAISAALGTGGGAPLDVALDQAREAVSAGVLSRPEVEEGLLQAYLFVGFPGVLDAFSAWRAGLPGGERSEAAPDDPLGGPGRESEREARGQEVCRTVYGSAYERLRSNVRRLHPDLDRWMILEGYGKVLGRPGLDLPTRELCVVALLAAAARAPQLHSHLRGALRSGAEEGRVRAALDTGLAHVADPARVEELEALWSRVRGSAGAAGER
jgi:4-carboxymuconolactone decarboxylase